MAEERFDGLFMNAVQ
jgi:hypothetical protein